MSEQTPSNAYRAAHVASFALLYALATAIARVLLAAPPAIGAAYYAGAAVALPFDVALGLALAWPLWKRPDAWSARFTSGAPAMLLIALHIAVTPRLPGAVSARYLEAIWLRALGGGLALGAGVLGMVGPLATKLERRFATRAGRVSDSIALGLLALLSVGASIGGFGDLYAGAVHPAVHLAFSAEGRETPAPDPVQDRRHEGHDHEHNHEHDHEGQPRYSPGDVVAANVDPPAEDGRPPGDVRVMASVMHQGDAVEPIPDTAYPYCTEAARPGPAVSAAGAAPPPSVILLVLRDVGVREMELDDAASAPVMPLLRRLGEEAVVFDDVYATGATDEDALVAMLSGQPPAPEMPVLSDPALPYLPGVARDLQQRGYRTAFFDGVRDVRTYRHAFLRMVGFEKVDVPAPGTPVVRDDAATFGQLQAWLSEDADAPRFAMLYGTPGAQRANGDATPDLATLQAQLAERDRQLAAFYTWYVQHEKPRGTVLLVVGDHPSGVAFPGDPEESTVGAGVEPRFRVPLAVDGLSEEGMNELRGRSSRLGSHTDLPRTILGLTGDDRRACYYGRDLFAGGDWPARRAPLSFGGTTRQFLLAHDGDVRWLFNVANRAFQIHDLAADPALQNDLFSEDDPELPRMREYLLSHVFIQRYMRLKRRYMPPPESLAVGPASGAPLRISDRGLLAGPRPAEEGAGRQSHPEVDAAEEAGFEWISFDTRMTRDRAFVTIGDVQLLELGDGVQVNVEDVTREQLETLRRPAPSMQELLRQHPAMRFVFQVHRPVRLELREAFVDTLVEQVQELPANRVMVACDDAVITSVLARRLEGTGVSVLLVASPEGAEGAEAWVQTAQAIGVPWLFVPAGAVNPEVFAAAERWGVRLGLHGVTGAGILQRLAAAGVHPAGFIASRAFDAVAP